MTFCGDQTTWSKKDVPSHYYTDHCCLGQEDDGERNEK